MSERKPQETRWEHVLRVAGTVVWALIPLWTLSFGTAPMMAWAAVRKRSWWQAATVPVYAAALVLTLVFDPDNGAREERIFDIALGVNIGLALVHSFVIRSWVFDDVAPLSPRAAKRKTLRAQQKAVLAELDDQAAARGQAMLIVRQNPQLAKQLRIGRPDVRRRDFPDGGLLDVNHVPAGTIAEFCGLTQRKAEEIVATRRLVGGFSSVADLSVTADLPPRALDMVADRLVFLPVSDNERSDSPQERDSA